MDGWNPWPATPPRRSPLVGVLIVLVTATVGVLAVGVTLISTRDQPVVSIPPGGITTPPSSPAAPPPRPPSPTPTPSPTRTLRPTKPPPTKPRDILVRNPLYDQRIVTTGCGQPPRPLPTGRRGDERYLNAMVRCLSRAYAGPLRAAGYRLTTPPVRVYTGSVQTPCGEGLKGYPIFYCPANQTIYSSAGSHAQNRPTIRRGGFWIALHAYAPHVQRRIDVLAAAYTRDEDQRQISRRIELQADCLMAMTGIAVRSTRLGPDDRAEMRAWRTAVPDEIHGRSASQLHWIDRGFGAGDFRRCSTWTATKHIR